MFTAAKFVLSNAAKYNLPGKGRVSGTLPSFNIVITAIFVSFSWTFASSSANLWTKFSYSSLYKYGQKNGQL